MRSGTGLGLRVGLGSGTGLVLGYELYVCKAVKGTPTGWQARNDYIIVLPVLSTFRSVNVANKVRNRTIFFFIR